MHAQQFSACIYCKVSHAVFFVLSFCPESTDGDVYRRLPALPAEYPGSDSLPENDMDRGNGGNLGVLYHCVHVLLVCKST